MAKPTNTKPQVECSECHRRFWDLKDVPGGTVAGQTCGKSSKYDRPQDDYCPGTYQAVVAGVAA